MTDYDRDDDRDQGEHTTWIDLWHHDLSHGLTRFIALVVIIALGGWFLTHLLAG
jgi:hypothetical protein